jgi:hypothetical protein
MDRRSFVLGGCLATVSSRLFAKQDTVGGLQRAYVTQPQLVRQQCPEWCWAASSSMIFAAHGHPIDQTKIVERIFGSPPACVPSGPTSTISQVLSEQWVDDGGQTFQPRITAGYDAYNGVVAITNAFIINELANDRPILYCNTHHAMVIVDFNYVVGPGGVIIPQQVGVLDPWPTNPPYHPLTPAEMYGVTMAPGGQMTYLAAVQV